MLNTVALLRRWHMSSASFDPLLSVRPVAEPPAPILDSEAPGELLPPASAEEARAVTAVFSRESQEKPPSLLGFAAAGMLLHDLIQDSLAPAAEEEEEEK